LLAVFAGLNFFAAPLLLIMPLIVKDVLHAQADWLAWLQLAFGFGSALVVLVFSFRKSFRQVYFIMCSSCFVMGVCLLGLAFSVEKIPVLLTLFVSGMAVAAVNALALSVFQETVPYELKGRFFSLLNTVCFAVLPLTFLLNGALAEMVRLPVLIMCNGLGTIVLSAIILFLPRLRDQVGGSVDPLTMNS
jgi:MFS family permease